MDELKPLELKAKFYQKINEVTKSARGLEKDIEVGKGTNSRYSAVSQYMVYSIVVPKMCEVGLVLLPGEELDFECKTISMKKKDYKSNQVIETDTLMTTVKQKFVLADIDTGYSEKYSAAGQGVDTQDKGAGKAYTYAEKNVLMKIFKIRAGKDEDTDTNHSEDIDREQLDNAIAIKRGRMIARIKDLRKPAGAPEEAKKSIDSLVYDHLTDAKVDSIEKMSIDDLISLGKALGNMPKQYMNDDVPANYADKSGV